MVRNERVCVCFFFFFFFGGGSKDTQVKKAKLLGALKEITSVLKYLILLLEKRKIVIVPAIALASGSEPPGAKRAMDKSKYTG